MNLVTIDNEKLWSKSKKNLLLGTWCIDNNHRYSKNIKKKYLISNYHWNNQTKYIKDIKYLYKIYNLFLNNLSSYLNKFHNLKYPTRYWEILLSPWLWIYLIMSYDRWEIIKNIKNKNKNLSAKVFYYDDKNFTPDSPLEFVKSFVHSDDWNHWIYTKMLKFVGEIDCSYVNRNKIRPKFLYKKEKINSNDYLLSSIFVPFCSQKIFSQNLYFSKKFQILYSIFYKQLRYRSNITLKNLNLPLNMDARFSFNKLLKKKDTFVKFACSLIQYSLPKIYLEHYDTVKESIKKFKAPSNPKIIMTSGDQSYNDAFKFYTAQKIINGTKYFIFQHGGYYGTCVLPHILEKIEIKLSDKFFSWGWKEGNKKISPLFLQKTIYQKISKKNNAAGLIIPISETYLCPGTHVNTGNPTNKMEVNKLIDNIVLFVSQIDQSILNNSSFKYLEAYKCHYVLKSLKFKFPNFKFINSIRNTCDISNSFRLTVETANSSGFLESLNLNIPIIFIYDKKYCSLRKSAIKDFEMLKKVKIVHNSPEEAAKFVNENYNHLEKWWNSKSLQKTKNNFCYKFARQSNSPLKDLKKALSYGK